MTTATKGIRRWSVVKVTPKVTEGTYVRDLQSMVTDWLVQWGEVRRRRSLLGDLLAGVTVAASALPLNLALANASGVPPSAAIVSGAVGGALAAIFAGTPLQVTGPAAALSVMVLAVAKQFGVVGVAACAFIVGIVQLILGFTTAGRFGRLVPESVLAGFTTGVGLKLLENQIPQLLGFDYRVGEMIGMMHRPMWLHDVDWLAVVCGLAVALLIVATSKYKRFPAALAAMIVVTALAVYLDWPIARVGTLPTHFPAPLFPAVNDDQWIDLAIAAVPIGILASVESLLSASVTDRMAPDQPRHNANLELVGQGIANVGVSLFSGMPVTGVVVRSGVNVQSGGKTRLSALFHAAVLAGAVMFAGRHLEKVPQAALAGFLCVIAFRLLEVRVLVHLAKTHKLEALAFLVTAIATVTGHLMMGLIAGLALHAVNHFLHRGEVAEKEQIERERERGIRATLAKDTHAAARQPGHWLPPPETHAWVENIRERMLAAKSAFVHRQASVIGRVVLGEHVHIAAGASVRADEGAPFFIGDDSNVQDGCVIHALRDKHVLVGGEKWAVYIGRHVSMAHDALVHGPCYIGDETFIGFKAVVHDSIVGEGCFIGICAVVVGVELPPRKFVPHGRIVDSQEEVERLPDVSETQREFNEDVVDVNRGLAVAYREQGWARDRKKPEEDQPEEKLAPLRRYARF